jgi:hypothetical protein
MAKRLRDALKSRGLELSRSTALEVAAAELGHDSWNVASVKLEDDRTSVYSRRSTRLGSPGLARRLAYERFFIEELDVFFFLATRCSTLAGLFMLSDVGR